MLRNYTNQKKQKQQHKQPQQEQEKAIQSSETNCHESSAETITEEEQLSIDNLCRLLYALYREQQFSKHNPKHF